METKSERSIEFATKFWRVKRPSWLSTGWDQGLKFLRWIMWKHFYSPVDTSNALEPAHIVNPQPPFIEQLPNEIITTIFSYVVHSDSTEHKDHYTYHIRRRISSGSSPTTPLILTRVCPLWRSIVQATPTLWSTIMVMSPAQSDVDFVSFLLGKTGNCLLSIGLEQYCDPDPASLAILNLFAAEAHRWKRVRFTLKMKNIQEMISILSSQQIKNLEEYRIRAETWDSAHTDEFFDLLHSSTALSSIDWGGSLPGLSREGISWSQISELSLRFTDLSTHLNALAACRSLKVLRLRQAPERRIIENLNPMPRFASVVLPRVERFVIGGPCDNSALFDGFTLPMLSHLELNDRNPYDDDLSGHGLLSLTNMVARSNCIIRILYLDASNMRVLLSPIFDGVHTLNVLSRVGEQELKLLVPFDYQRRRPRGLPNLKRLTLHNWEARDSVLSNVVWPRRENLEILELCMDIDKFPQDYGTLLRLKKQGLLLTVSERVPDFPLYIFRANYPRNAGSQPLVYLPNYWEDLW